MVDEKLHAKISDFGLSRILAKEDTYYKLSNVAKLPVKWMALESIEYRKFSTFSDGKLLCHCVFKFALYILLCIRLNSMELVYF